MTSPHRMTDHWWWRPGVRPGRRMYVWHILFGDRPRVAELIGRLQRRLDGLDGFDPVPAAWLHMTTQVVGFGDEITADEVAAMIEAAGERLSRLEPITVTLGRVILQDEAVVGAVTLVSQERKGHSYVWDPVSTVRLGGVSR